MKKKLIIFNFLFLSFIFYNLKSANIKNYKNPKGFNIQKEKPARIYRDKNAILCDNLKSYKRESPTELKKIVDPHRTPIKNLVKCIGCGVIVLDCKPSKSFKTKTTDSRREDGFNKKNTWSEY